VRTLIPILNSKLQNKMKWKLALKAAETAFYLDKGYERNTPVDNLLRNRKAVRAEALKNNKAAKQNQKYQHDKKAIHRVYKEKDLVLVQNDRRKSKEQPHYLGPMVVIKVIGSNLLLKYNHKYMEVSKDKCKPYTPSTTTEGCESDERPRKSKDVYDKKRPVLLEEGNKKDSAA
jgi:hypothetical protein